MTIEDPAALLALIHRYADLREAAPGEGEHGSPMTAARLTAHATTIEAEIRLRLGVPAPSPDQEPRNLLNLSTLVDSTSGCPVADQCAGCGATERSAAVILQAALVTTAVGVNCVTLCWDCHQTDSAPAPRSLEAAYALALWHADHLGVELPYLNGQYPGCPACSRLHFPWCPPYGGPGYAAAATAGEDTP